MDSVVLSFRAHKNIRSWLDYASKGFKGKGELLYLILTKAALEQASESSVGVFMKSIFTKKEIAVGLGDTTVFAVRLPVSVYELIKDCAAKRGKTPSEWSYLALLDWHRYFSELYEKFNRDQGQAWLPQYGLEYRARIDEIGNVYAQKTGKALV